MRVSSKHKNELLVLRLCICSTLQTMPNSVPMILIPVVKISIAAHENIGVVRVRKKGENNYGEGN